MADAVLVVNAGSSSVKFAVFAEADGAEPALMIEGQVEGLRTNAKFVAEDGQGDVLDRHAWDMPIGHREAIEFILDWNTNNATHGRIVAAGHRVVFGGEACTGPAWIDAELLDRVEALVPFFPLHLPHNLAAIRAISDSHPDLPQVACFDNMFHRTLPKVARWFALPREMMAEGIRRYGYHGLSYEYIAGRLPEIVPDARRVVVAHLGSGASMCALSAGKSIETTLGFSGCDGLPMGTRTGSIDPGALLFLMQSKGMDAGAIERLIYTQSGLLGVSGISNDMRDLLASDDGRAAEAVELFVYHIGKHLGALAAVLGGLDAVVFTAGVGENAAPIRARVCRDAAWLGIALDEARNRTGGPRITTNDSAVSAWVIPTNEERMIALHTLRVLGERGL